MTRRKTDFSGCINFARCKAQIIGMLLDKLVGLQSVSKKDLIRLIEGELPYAEKRKDTENEVED